MTNIHEIYVNCKRLIRRRVGDGCRKRFLGNYGKMFFSNSKKWYIKTDSLNNYHLI